MRRAGWRRLLLWTFALALLATGVIVAVLRSGWFLAQVRGRIVGELERGTGGRASIGGLEFDWTTGRARAMGIVLHGLEGPGEPPLLRVEEMETGLKIVSVWRRDVDVRWMTIRNAQVRLTVDAGGVTNIPGPRTPAGKPWTEHLVRARVGRFELKNATLLYNDRRVPLDGTATGVDAVLDFEPRRARYVGSLRAASVGAAIGEWRRLEASVDAAFTLDSRRIDIGHLRLATRASTLEAKGSLTKPDAPVLNLAIKAAVSAADVPESRLAAGVANLEGNLTLDTAHARDFVFRGKVDARNLAYADGRVRLRDSAARAAFELGGDRLELSGVEARVLSGVVKGRLNLAAWKTLTASGSFEELSSANVLEALSQRPAPWDGILRGEWALSTNFERGSPRGTAARVEAVIAPAPAGRPLAGYVNADWSQDTGKLTLANSTLTLPSSRIDASGVAGESLRVKLESGDLGDVQPLMDALGLRFPEGVSMASVSGEATISGDLADPVVDGRIAASKVTVRGHAIEQVRARGQAASGKLSLSQFALERTGARVEGSLTAGLSQWKWENGPVDANLKGAASDVDALLTEFDAGFHAAGSISVTAAVRGALDAPVASVTFTSPRLQAGGETVSKVSGIAEVRRDSIEVQKLQMEAAGSPVQASGLYRHPRDDYRSGEFVLSVDVRGAALSAVEAWKALDTSIDGRASGKLALRGRIRDAGVEIAAADGEVSVRGISFRDRRLGDLTASARTSGTSIETRAALDLRGEKVEAAGTWDTARGLEGSAEVRFPQVGVQTLRDFAPRNSNWDDLPFEGSLRGNARIQGALSKPDSLSARLNIESLKLNPRSTQNWKLGVDGRELTLENSGPIVFDVTKDSIRLQDAHFVAPDTDIRASGKYSPAGAGDAAINLSGNVNLSILQLVNKDLLARGVARMNASLRGALSRPSIDGRLELANASLYLADFPNGVDKANGTVRFDNGRATIEKLTAETGGGQLQFGGFLEYSGPALVYRLQARASSVRVRYPEDLSITATANLSLTGTSENSVLSGVVSVNKMSFQPRTDFGQLLAASAKPSASLGAPGEYLKGLQFDVRIESAQDMQVNTSLSSNVLADIDLKLRGSPQRPALLGSVSVDSGDIQAFGNRYTISRGEVRFFNPLKIEPVFDVDLETKARGVLVSIAFTGTLSKLNVAYRSDPPLQTREIIALLAVGRDPASTTAGAGSVNAQSSFLQGGDSLLGQAVSAQLSNRLQRFFGVSRLKIDPQLTGVENIPQARLTLEQQVSKDITVTYITNLNRAQSQVVQVQWDISKEWSMVAVRDENGVFGVDFQYRRRFK